MADTSKLLAATAQLTSDVKKYLKATGPDDQAEVDQATEQILAVDAEVVKATPVAP